MTDLLSHFFWAESGGRIHSCQVKFELEAVHRPFFKPGFPTPLREAMVPWIDDWWPIRSYPTVRHKDDRNIEVIYQIDPNWSKLFKKDGWKMQNVADTLHGCVGVWLFFHVCDVQEDLAIFTSSTVLPSAILSTCKKSNAWIPWCHSCECQVATTLPASHSGQGMEWMKDMKEGTGCIFWWHLAAPFYALSLQDHWMKRLQHYDAVDEETRQVCDHMLKDHSHVFNSFHASLRKHISQT